MARSLKRGDLAIVSRALSAITAPVPYYTRLLGEDFRPNGRVATSDEFFIVLDMKSTFVRILTSKGFDGYVSMIYLEKMPLFGWKND